MGVLVGAGIFRVTGDAWTLTGSSVVLGYVVLAVPLLATSVPYIVFLSSPVGAGPGGEYTHIREATGGDRVAAWAAWLKVVSYVGALAFLAEALADYTGGGRWVAQGALTLVIVVHIAGVRWFGRVQVVMFLLLAASVVVLVVPGLFAIRVENYEPFFKEGPSGFFRALPPLFFAYAGFESIAHAAGEVRDGRNRLPRVMAGGILITMVIFVSMSAVAFGTVEGSALARSQAPMRDVAASYLPGWGAWFVTLGAVMALATSLNSTALVPSRIALALSDRGMMSPALARIDPRTGTPIIGLVVTWVLASALMWSGQLNLALRVAVFALVLVYLVHTVAALRLPSANPGLFAEVRLRIPPRLLQALCVLSLLTLGVLIVVQLSDDLQVLRSTSLGERWATQSMTTIELIAIWSGLGAVVLRRRRRTATPA